MITAARAETKIRPMPIDAYWEPILARTVGKDLLTITALSGVTARWFHIMLMDIDTDDIIAAFRYRLDLAGPHDPFFTGVLIDGKPLMFDPAGGYVYATDWGDEYAEDNQADSIGPENTAAS